MISGVGVPDQVHARIFKQVQVTLKVTRVFGKILVRPKLHRVDKMLTATQSHQPGAAGKRNMPFVEGSPMVGTKPILPLPEGEGCA